MTDSEKIAQANTYGARAGLAEKVEDYDERKAAREAFVKLKDTADGDLRLALMDAYWDAWQRNRE